ncbi:penicillin-binding protein 1A [Marinobacteraceae bacterium S3BR75-40.1]
MALCFGGGALLLSAFFLYLQPGLPAVDSLRDVRLQTPLRIYSSDKQLIAEFGEKRREPITIDKIPDLQVKAFLAAEDSRFYVHHGVDVKGLVRAALELATTGEIQSGGSTITMQVAKNFFLSRERTFIRKFNEILLALQIEQELPKSEILELYLNKIYLGNRAYGVESAAQVYYGKSVADLDLQEMAMIAGLPKAPSAYNPLANAQRALSRRNWILSRMQELGYITQQQAQQAKDTPITAEYHGPVTELKAPHVAEMARYNLVSRVGEAAYTEGYRVYVTIDSKLQRAAQEAIRTGLHAYDKRHGYRGPIAQLDVGDPVDDNALREKLKSFSSNGILAIAAITNVSAEGAQALTADGERVFIPFSTMEWARPYINEDRRGAKPETTGDVVAVGDVVRLKPLGKTDDTPPPQPAQSYAALSQLPKVQGALVSLDPKSGAIKALVGGYSFSDSKYNRATQAMRQPGSNFKPFLYLAALENGATAATVINDAPIVFDDSQLETTWRPQNAGGHFYGPTRLREGLYKSRNLVSIRLLKATGIDTVINYIQHLGLDTSRLPKDLSLALGSATYTPLEIVKGFATIANGGYAVNSYLIERISRAPDEEIYQAPKVELCDPCPDEGSPQQAQATETPSAENTQTSQKPDEPTVIHPPRVAEKRAVYIMQSMLRDVIRKGTGRRALALGRTDIAGKTGTTNDQRDAWFSGFNANLVTTVWVGFDTPKPLGRGEYGAAAALPIWLDYMEVALKDQPNATMPQPPGLVTVRIDPETGKRAAPGASDAIFEIFREENAPAQIQTSDHGGSGNSSEGETGVLPQQLF